jgi:DNA-binding GntR family transcriptional regulator
MEMNTREPLSTRAAHADPAGGRIERLAAVWQRFQHAQVAADAIHATLREAILGGILPAGERLAEVHLASLFNRSRTPVREAILRLESEGLTERSARRGVVVCTISRDEVLEVYAVREALDGLAARLAALGILPSELDNLRWLNSRMRDAAGREDFQLMLEINMEFHEAIARASRNSLLVLFIRHIHDWVRRFPDSTFAYPGRASNAVDEHDGLIRAIAEREYETAERLARSHMSRAMQVRILMLQTAR